MIAIRKANDRGHADHGWLDSRHTFSFGGYHDPRQMGFRSLRVVNEDRVAPGGGFPTHPHRDMEIVSYVLEGALEHRDSMGNGAVLRAGEFQRMSAGSGITHSEFNASQTDPVHFYQVWIVPERRGIEPDWEQRGFDPPAGDEVWQTVAEADPSGDSLRIRQDVKLLRGIFAGGSGAKYAVAPGRHAWVQIARGAVALNGHELHAGDGAAISDEPGFEVQAREDSELLVFDMA